MKTNHELLTEHPEMLVTDKDAPIRWRRPGRTIRLADFESFGSINANQISTGTIVATSLSGMVGVPMQPLSIAATVHPQSFAFHSPTHGEMMRIDERGIFVHGRLVTTDEDIVNGMRAVIENRSQR